MLTKDIFKIVFRNLRRAMFRTVLTTMGVVIGTAAIISMVSIGIGMQQSLTEQLESFGDVTVINVFSPQGGRGPRAEETKLLDDDAIKEFEKIDGVVAATPLTGFNGEIAVGRYSSNLLILGIDAKKAKLFGFNVVEGRDFSRTDKNVMLVGYKVPESFYVSGEKYDGRLDLTGKRATIVLERFNEDGKKEKRNQRIKIIGLVEEKGTDEDYNVYMPLETVVDLISWRYNLNYKAYLRSNGYSQVWVKVENPEIVLEVQNKINNMGYRAFSLKQLIEIMGNTFAIIQAILGGIGAIALIVAALGIINTMIMSIYERTKEIGIMKTVGGSNRDVMNIFLVEASVIGFMGGVGGIILGHVVSFVIDKVASMYLSQGGAQQQINITIIPFWLVAVSLVFAVFVGLVAGMYPARRAAKLSPIESLRHE